MKTLIPLMLFVSPALSHATSAVSPAVYGSIVADVSPSLLPMQFENTEIQLAFIDSCEETQNTVTAGFISRPVDASGRYEIPAVNLSVACPFVEYSAALVDKVSKKQFPLTSGNLPDGDLSRIASDLREIRYTTIRQPTKIYFHWDGSPQLSNYILQIVQNSDPVAWDGHEWKPYIRRRPSNWKLAGAFGIPGHYGFSEERVGDLGFSSPCGANCLVDMASGNRTELEADIPAAYDYVSADKLAKGKLKVSDLKGHGPVTLFLVLNGVEESSAGSGQMKNLHLPIADSVTLLSLGNVNEFRVDLAPMKTSLCPCGRSITNVNF
jgi:hypothetical protein